MTPKGSDITCRSHGIGKANKKSESGHSLEVQREIIFHDGCFPKAPNISLIFSYDEITCAISKWWGKHLPNIDLL